MNQELKKQLQKENDEELFFFFKSDGSLDFEKKMIAGILLQERQYDKKLLQAEKNIILESYQKRIQENKNSDNIINKKRKEVRNSAVFAVATLVITAMIYWQKYNGRSLEKQPPTYVYIAIAVLFVGLFVYRLVNYKDQVAKLVEAEKENTEILKKRVQVIEKEWSF